MKIVFFFSIHLLIIPIKTNRIETINFIEKFINASNNEKCERTSVEAKQKTGILY